MLLNGRIRLVGDKMQGEEGARRLYQNLLAVLPCFKPHFDVHSVG
jgi:hypothetical protein